VREPVEPRRKACCHSIQPRWRHQISLPNLFFAAERRKRNQSRPLLRDVSDFSEVNLYNPGRRGRVSRPREWRMILSFLNMFFAAERKKSIPAIALMCLGHLGRKPLYLWTKRLQFEALCQSAAVSTTRPITKP